MLIEFLTSNNQLIAEIEQFCAEWKSDQEEFTVQTSGSTGLPKSIVLKREQIRASAKATNDFFNNKAGDTALLCLSPSTIGGKMMLVRSFEANMKLIVVEPSKTPLEHIEQSIDFAAMVPMQVAYTLEKHPNKFQYVKRTIIGGANVSGDLVQQILDCGATFYQTFGMTETISHFAVKQLGPKQEDHYTCLPGVTIGSIEGTLVVNYPALNIRNLRTNDLVELLDENRFKWLGRKDYVINSGGVKIHPEQIESRLSGLIRLPFFAFGIADATLGERHVLAIESREKLHVSKAQLSEVLSKYEIPKELWYYSQFNYTNSGKINRLNTIKIAPEFVGKVL